MAIKKLFEERRDNFQLDFRKLENLSKRWSGYRLIFTLIIIVCFIVFANLRLAFPMILTVMLYVPIFGLMVRKHNKVRKEKEWFKSLVKINEDELARLDLELAELDKGDEYIDINHPYSSDLDLFGRHSLFQLVNRTSTFMGRTRLSFWMKHGAARQEILDRQDAVKELSSDIEWIQEFQAAGMTGGVEAGNVNRLVNWLKEPEEGAPSVSMFFIFIGIIFLLACGVLVATGVISFGWLLFPLALNTGILIKYYARLKFLMDETFEGNKSLVSIYRMISMVESSEFHATGLVKLNSAFRVDGIPASQTLKKLNRILDQLNARANIFYAIINVITLYDYFLHRQISNWKRKYGSYVIQWFEALAYMECLNSLAGLKCAQPEMIFPAVSASPYKFKVSQMGHPLIHPSKRVNNDVILEEEGSVSIITGSNMSGKSTFLRTVGINICLAQMGAPVLATEMEFSRVRLFTSMRNADLLEENMSSFYAELKRIQALLQYIDEDPVMYMIDEVLKGTNSTDRHLGSVSLIRQLTNMRCFGWVSTHDLSLGELGGKFEKVRLHSFNSQIDNGELSFDYKLSEGLCNSFNASILMKKMGIDIREEEIGSHT